MKKYELRKNTRQIMWCDRRELKEGCSHDTSPGAANDPEILKSFDSKEEALEELKKYKTEISEYNNDSHFFYIEEYYIEENNYEYDEDCESFEWIDGGDIWEYSKMEIRVRDVESYDVVAICSSYVEAEKFVKIYEKLDSDDIKDYRCAKICF